LSQSYPKEVILRPLASA